MFIFVATGDVEANVSEGRLITCKCGEKWQGINELYSVDVDDVDIF